MLAIGRLGRLTCVYFLPELVAKHYSEFPFHPPLLRSHLFTLIIVRHWLDIRLHILHRRRVRGVSRLKRVAGRS